MDLKRIMAAAATAAALAGCVTPVSSVQRGTEQSITVPYDPYNYDPDELYEQAQSHCSAYGRRAVYIDETIDPNSVRWRYRHYDCV